MRDSEPDRSILIKALKESFSDKVFEELLEEVRWSSLNGCWLVEYCGMTVGIEPDGYVHS